MPLASDEGREGPLPAMAISYSERDKCYSLGSAGAKGPSAAGDTGEHKPSMVSIVVLPALVAQHEEIKTFDSFSSPGCLAQKLQA